MKNKKQAFTFIELIIVSIILIIISTIGFYSYSKYVGNSKDSERKSNIATLSSGLKNYKQDKGIYPIPSDYFTLTNSGTEVAKQGKIDDLLSLTSLNKIPSDPSLNIPYLYGVSENKKEYQIGTTLENNGNPIALVEGDYKSVSKNILPSLLIAYNGKDSIDISKEPYKNKFIINGLAYNLPYNLENGTPFSSSGTILSGILIELDEKFWQNIDYKSCVEICNAGKSVGDGEYQILGNSGALVNTICDFKEGECETENIIITNYCSISTPINSTLTMGSPNMPNQSWQRINPSNPCYFTCNTNYSWNGMVCAPNTRKIMNCAGSLPNNTSWVDQKFTQTWNGTDWIPSLLSCSQGTTGEGKFNCNAGFTWDGSTCIASTQTGACTGLPATNASWNTVSSITQTWNGSAWTPSITGTYNTSASTSECRFKCNTNYTWNSSACVASTQTGACTGLPATNASWNTVSSITQTRNGSAWTPSTTGTYNISPSTSECRFKCNTGFTWDGDSCEIDSDYTTKQMFASGNQYTFNWSSTCNPNLMTIVNVNPGTDTIPQNLNSNTIYKFVNGNYITTRAINMGGNCTGIIGLGNTSIYSNNSLSAMFNLNGSKFIISGVNIDGKGNGSGGSHGTNNECIGSIYSVENLTLNDVQIYNNTNAIDVNGSLNNSSFNNTQIYNNGNAIRANGDISYSSFNNTQIYNNGDAISANGDISYSSINNTQIYNNGSAISANGGLDNSSINNTQIYNNGNAIDINSGLNSLFNNIQIYNNGTSIRANGDISYSLFNNLQIYNNSSNPFDINGSFSNTKYYGNTKIFGNLSNSFGASAGLANQNLPGTSQLASSVGFTDGTLSTTGTMACTYHSQPNIASWGTNCADKSNKISSTSATSYNYGTNILFQIQPIKYIGTYSVTLYGTNGTDYDTTKHIGDM